MENLKSDDYYKILGVAKNASEQAIKTAFKILCQKYHPDKGGDAEYFHKIKHAYDILMDKRKRAYYDKKGKDSDYAVDFQAMAEQVISSLFLNCFEFHKYDINLDYKIAVTKAIKSSITKTIENIEDTKNKLKHIEVFISKFKCKKSIIEKSTEKLEKLKGELDTLEESLHVYELSFKLLKKIEYDYDKNDIEEGYLYIPDPNYEE